MSQDQTADARAEVRRLRHLLAQCGDDRQRYYEALVNIVALDAIPRADLGDAVGYAQEALGELQRQRSIDLAILWPVCKEQANDLDHAKMAFAMHAFHDPAWLPLGDDEIRRQIDALS